MSELRRITERYRLDKLVAASESSSVFRGVDAQSGDTVAVKLLNSDGAESEEQRERFLELCRTLQSIHHPSLPRVLDFGFTTAGSAFLVTELLSGESLENPWGLSPTRAIGLLLGVVDGLEALAQAGLACRNLQAANLLVAPVAGGEQVKIIGLGSPALRPERAEEVPSAAEAWRQDLFDFGNLIYRLLGLSTGTYYEVVVPQEVAARLADFDALSTLVQAALQKDPKGRFPSCTEVRRALHQALFGHAAVSATPQGTLFVPGMGNAGVATVEVRPERETPTAAQTISVPLSSLPEPGKDAPPEPPRDPGNETRILSSATDDSATVFVPAGQSLLDAETAGTVRLPRSAAPAAPAAPAGADFAGTVRIPGLPPLPSPLPPSASRAAAAPAPPPPRPAPPRPVPPVPAAATAPTVAAKGPGRGRLSIVVGATAGVVLLAGLAFLGFRPRPAPAPPPAVPAAVATPLPSPAVAVQPEPLAVNPMIEKADAALAKNDLKAVKAALDSISVKDRAALRPDERARYQRLVDSLAPLKRAEWAAHLAQALETGDLRALRRAVEAVPAAEEAGLPAPARRELGRGRQALEAESRLSRAEKAGDHLDVIRQAAALLRELPRSARAGELRNQAARAVETEVDAAIDAGQYEAAATRLDELRQVWPERPDLAARTDRIAAEKKSDQEMESLLAAAGRSGKANRPLEGLQLLADVKPGRRYADRIQDLRQRLNAQFAQIDRQAPVLALRSPDAQYEKGKTATIALRIADDFAVKSAEGWARAEGGQYAKVAVRHLSGADYTLDVPPDVHQNKTIEFYATAADSSGHTGLLGSAERPLKMKRKGLLTIIFGSKNEG